MSDFYLKPSSLLYAFSSKFFVSLSTSPLLFLLLFYYPVFFSFLFPIPSSLPFLRLTYVSHVSYFLLLSSLFSCILLQLVVMKTTTLLYTFIYLYETGRSPWLTHFKLQYFSMSNPRQPHTKMQELDLKPVGRWLNIYFEYVLTYGTHVLHM